MPTAEWTNWNGNQSCTCDVRTPETVADLQTEVAAAATPGRRVRPAGTGYSWTPLIPVPATDTIISTTKLNRLVDLRSIPSPGPGVPERHFIKVEAGMLMSELIALTHGNGLTLRSPTLFPWPTVAGAISTGSHGVGRKLGCFADSVTSIDIVRADGSLQTVDKSDPEFGAVMVSLGSLGVIARVELEVSAEFNVYVDKRNIPVRRCLDEFDDLIAAYDYVEMFWMPGSEDFYFLLMDPSVAHEDEWSFDRKARRWVSAQAQERLAQHLVPWVAQRVPRLTPLLTRLAGATVTQVDRELIPASEAFHFQDAYVKNWDISYSVPASDAARAWSDAIDLVEAYAAVGQYPINYALHGRFVGPGEGWLAPNYDRPSLFIEATTAIDTPGFQTFFDELEDRWAAIPGARPHWGKHFSRTTGLGALYPKMADFLALRQTWDPDRHFLNPWLEHQVFALP